MAETSQTNIWIIPALSAISLHYAKVKDFVPHRELKKTVDPRIICHPAEVSCHVATSLPQITPATPVDSCKDVKPSQRWAQRFTARGTLDGSQTAIASQSYTKSKQSPYLKERKWSHDKAGLARTATSSCHAIPVWDIENTSLHILWGTGGMINPML
jgi:hypothetical protein